MSLLPSHAIARWKKLAFRLRKSLLAASRSVWACSSLHGVHIWSQYRSIVSPRESLTPTLYVQFLVYPTTFDVLLPRRCKPLLYGETLAAPCIIDRRFSPFQVVPDSVTGPLFRVRSPRHVAGHRQDRRLLPRSHHFPVLLLHLFRGSGRLFNLF